MILPSPSAHTRADRAQARYSVPYRWKGSRYCTRRLKKCCVFCDPTARRIPLTLYKPHKAHTSIYIIYIYIYIYIARAFTAFRAWGLNFKGIEIQHFSSQLVITLHSHLHAYGRAVNISVDVPKCVLALLLTEPSWQLLLNLGGFHGLTKTRLH